MNNLTNIALENQKQRKSINALTCVSWEKHAPGDALDVTDAEVEELLAQSIKEVA